MTDLRHLGYPDRSEALRTKLTPSEAEALAFLVPLSADYPGIDRWYRSKVVPGLRDGTRYLLRIVRNESLVGLGIAKMVVNEHKICTVRVAPSYVGRGIGVRIFDGLLRWLDDDRPHLTVSDARLPKYEKIFDYFGFALTSKHRGRYIPQSTEYGYNELLAKGFSALPADVRPTRLEDPVETLR